MLRRSATLFVSSLVVMLMAGQARAQESVALVQVEHRPPIGVELSLGVRGDQIHGAGFDAFSDDHALTELALAASYRISGSRASGVSAGVIWNHGQASSTARGSDSTLTLDRLSLSLQAQRSIWRHLTLFARVAPGFVRVNAELADSSASGTNYTYGSQTTLAQHHWTLAVEGAAGAALLVGEIARPGEHAYALWFTAEGGYSVAGSTALALGPTGGPAPARTSEPVQLGSLTPGGAFMNFAAVLTF